MSARLTALFCLIVVCLGAQSQQPAEEIYIYLRGSQVQPAASIEAMKREFGTIVSPAGLNIVWRESGPEPAQAPEGAEVVMVSFNGVCAAPTSALELQANSPALADTSITDGRILPFSTIQCQTLSQLLAPALLKEPSASRSFLYGRAMARVLAHELYHIVAQTTDHVHAGIARRGLNAENLLTETYGFDSAATERIRQRFTPITDSFAASEEAGRER